MYVMFTYRLHKDWSKRILFFIGHQYHEPALKELSHYFEDISSCWKELALELDLPYKTVKRINQDHSNIKDKCYDMFSTWLERSPDACWCHIIFALNECKMFKLAKDIEESFLSMCSVINKWRILPSIWCICKLFYICMH